MTIFLWAFSHPAERRGEWARDNFQPRSFADTGLDVAVLSLVRSVVQFTLFEYHRSKTHQSLVATSAVFAFSTAYLSSKVLYGTLVAKNSANIPVAAWGLLIGAAQFALFLAFRRRPIRVSIGGRGAGAHADVEHVQLESKGVVLGGESASLGDVELGSVDHIDHLAYVDSPTTIHAGTAADGVDPASLRDQDSQFVNLLGIQIHYKLWKKGNSEASRSREGSEGDEKEDRRIPERARKSRHRPALVLLHGFGGSNYDWRAVWEPLQAHASLLLSLDMPGAGLTSRPPARKDARVVNNPYSQRFACRLLIAALDWLGIERVTLIGHGRGGALAVHAATMHPRRVKRLILVAPMVFMDTYPKFIRDLFRTSIGKEIVVALVRSQIGELVLRKAWFDRSRISKAKMRWHASLVRVRNWLTSQVELSRAEPLRIRPGDLEDIACPVGVIHGEKDRIVPVSNSARFVNYMERSGCSHECRFIKIERCGHVPHEELPRVFVECVSQFLKLFKT